jgi:hypothetical protein
MTLPYQPVVGRQCIGSPSCGISGRWIRCQMNRRSRQGSIVATIDTEQRPPVRLPRPPSESGLGRAIASVVEVEVGEGCRVRHSHLLPEIHGERATTSQGWGAGISAANFTMEAGAATFMGLWAHGSRKDGKDCKSRDCAASFFTGRVVDYGFARPGERRSVR